MPVPTMIYNALSTQVAWTVVNVEGTVEAAISNVLFFSECLIMVLALTSSTVRVGQKRTFYLCKVP